MSDSTTDPRSVPDRTADVVVVGAGAIGTAIGWRCAQAGASVVLVDPDPSRGAWRTAAGMLAPVTELHYTESALLRLNLESARRWPEYAAELSAATGRPTGYRECGTLELAWDGADLRALHDLHSFGRSLGLASTLLSGREIRGLEPSVAPGVPGGLLAEYDHQVDPRLLHAAQLAAGRACGVTTVTAAATVTVAGDRATGVRLSGGGAISAGTVVLAAGAWSAGVEGLPAPPAVRPVKGQTLRLRLAGEDRLGRVVRGSVKGSPVYLVPRGDGRIVVGASSEEAGFDVQPRAGAVYELLRDAQSLVPELGEAVLEEVSTGLRPGSADNAPLIGPTQVTGLIYATGHYRNGILLAPITADTVAAYVRGEPVAPVAAAFAPQRREVVSA